MRNTRSAAGLFRVLPTSSHPQGRESVRVFLRLIDDRFDLHDRFARTRASMEQR